ncbi:MAG: tetratricopeptide repeat protein [Thermoguttaceae bacterium]
MDDPQPGDSVIVRVRVSDEANRGESADRSCRQTAPRLTVNMPQSIAWRVADESRPASQMRTDSLAGAVPSATVGAAPVAEQPLPEQNAAAPPAVMHHALVGPVAAGAPMLLCGSTTPPPVAAAAPAPEQAEAVMPPPVAPPAMAPVQVVDEPRPAPPVALATPTSLMIVSRRAGEHIQYAFDLLGHGAVHSAQAEFIQALRLLTQALDTETHAQQYGPALTAALTAFQEAEDFVPEDGHRATSLDLSRLIATHRTPVLKNANTGDMTPLVALQSYYTYAKDQLAIAGGRLPAASMALYGWARLQSVLGSNATPGGMQTPKALALHQAALKVDPRNYLAANELGVLMARYGELEESRRLLLQSLSIAQRSETWHNLAVVYDNLGQKEQARAAQQRCRQLFAAERAGQDAAGGLGGVVYWVDAGSFAQQSDPSGLGESPPHSAGAAPQQPPAAVTPPKQNTNFFTALNSKRLLGLRDASENDKSAGPPTTATNQEGLTR